MTVTTFPSPIAAHRRLDLAVHVVGLGFIIIAGTFLIIRTFNSQNTPTSIAVVTYILCGLASNLASFAYHFSDWHDRRVLLRRIDHAAIYLSISGTFTPFFVEASKPWTLFLLCLCWGLSAIAVWHKIYGARVKSNWSTASYLGLGAIGLCALPDLNTVPLATLWCIVGGACAYVVGTLFYVRKGMIYRYAIWHCWVTLGGVMMFAGIWIAMS